MNFRRSISSRPAGCQIVGIRSHFFLRKVDAHALILMRIMPVACIFTLITLLFISVFHSTPAGAQSGATILSVTATQPIAGATPGVFTVKRTGDTNQPLSVPLSLSGTATMNLDYTADTSASAALPASFAPGKVARAFSFDGQGQYVQAAEDPKLDPTEEATIDAWVFFNQLPSASGNAAMVIADKSDFGRDFLLDAEPDNRFHFSIGVARKVASATVIQTGRWYHVAATYKALTEVKIYLNGVLENTLAIDMRRAPAAVPFTIGRTLGLAFATGPTFFNGLIDEVHVFNRVLSDAEIRSIFAADTAGLCKSAGQTPNCVPPPAGLVGWFAGDGDARDISENIFPTGKVAQAFALNGAGQHFNGTGEYVQYPDNLIQDPTTETTVDAWVYFNQLPSETGHFMSIIAKSEINRFLDLVALGDDKIRFFSGFNSVSTNTVMQKGRWYHIAATFKADVEMRMYVNGVLENTQPISGGRGANDSPLTIGNSAFDRTRVFSGLIDEAQMYSRALATAEIQSIYNADSTGLCKPVAVTGCVQPPAGLVGWWTGDGDTRDLVTNARGTLVGYDNRLFGQQLTFAAGQTSITVNIRPLFSPNSAGKTVVLTLLPDSQNSYALDESRSSAIIAFPGQTASSEVSLTGIYPNKGGNTASVTPIIYGQGFKPGVTVKLVRAGQTDIVATQTTPAPDEFSVAARFDLNGKAQGVYDVVVANAGGTAKALTGAFAVEQTKPTQLFVKVSARRVIRIGNEYPFYVLYGNRGNTDATNVPFYLSVPSFVSITPDTDLSYQTAQINGRTVISLTLPRVRAGSDLSPEVLSVKIKVADPNRLHNVFRLRAAFNLPYVTSATSGLAASGDKDMSVATVKRYIPEGDEPPPPPPDDGDDGGGDDGGGDTDPRTPNDPNEKSGSGLGVQGFISGKTTLPYAIYFENKDTASLPAQDVVVTDQLDLSKVDAATFNFGVISFGKRVFTPPAGQTSFVGYVDLRPDKNLLVKISADFNPTTGRITWTFNSLDAATGRPPDDPLVGFLPPNKTSPEGQGAVLFTVMPKASLTTDTAVTNTARIVFDVNAPIDTNVYLNTIDKSPPISRVTSLAAAQLTHSFEVNWSGTDAGSGIGSYNVFVSENSGPFTLWQTNTMATSAIYYGRANTTYRFYSIANDLVGNQEPAKTTAEATTLTPTGNPITDPRWFAHQHYIDFLSREPDGPGLTFWTGEITECNDPAKRQPGESQPMCTERKRANTSAAFFLSPEFQNTGSFVVRVYWGTLGKLPNTPKATCPSLPDGYTGQCRPLYSDYIADASQIASGIVVNDQLDQNVINANKRAFVDRFVNTPAFKAKYDSLNNQQFVDTLFQTTGINASASDRAALVNGLNAQPPTETRSSVVFKVVDGTTTLAGGALRFDTSYGKAYYDKEFDDAFVFMEYIGYLRRNPDQAGYEFWLGKLKLYGNWQDAQMVLAFISSPEYRARFGQP